MTNISIQPSDKCVFLINRFLFLKATDEHDRIEEKYIPDGCMAFVFNFEGKVTVSNESLTYELPPFFVVLPAMQSLVIRTYPPIDTMVVVCKSTVFTRLFNIDLAKSFMKPFFDGLQVIPLNIWDNLKHHNNDDKRKSIFESFVMQQLNEEYIHDEIDRVYHTIIQSRGEIQVNQLLNQIQISPRSLRRKFISRAGLCAKELSRLVRVNYLWDCYLKGNKADFQSMVYDGNYHDQSHLINDFKKIVGESPLHFFKKEQANKMMISGKLLE